MSHTGNKTLDEAINNIQAMYLRNLDSQIRYLRDLLDSINASPGAQPALVELQEKSHRINGVAGTLGFNQLGEIAKRVEITAADVYQANSSNTQLGELVALVEELLEHMQKLRRH